MGKLNSKLFGLSSYITLQSSIGGFIKPNDGFWVIVFRPEGVFESFVVVVVVEVVVVVVVVEVVVVVDVLVNLGLSGVLGLTVVFRGTGTSKQT